MEKIILSENQTKNFYFQRLVDCCIILLLSIIVLSIYESDWCSVHTSKENMLAIQFDMFSLHLTLVFLLFMYGIPNAFGFFGRIKFLYRYTSENKLSARLVRALKIVIVTVIIVLCSIMFADKYSRVEFYNDGSIIEYNKENQIVNEYLKSDVDFVELEAVCGHSSKHVYYRAVANIYVNDSYYTLSQKNYIAPDTYVVNPDTERSLYGLKKVKEIFSDKITINKENIDTLLEVEHLYYTKGQAKELCEIFEVDFDEMMLWLEEEWDIVLEND